MDALVMREWREYIYIYTLLTPTSQQERTMYQRDSVLYRVIQGWESRQIDLFDR